jgi:hypothetical protein
MFSCDELRQQSVLTLIIIAPEVRGAGAQMAIVHPAPLNQPTMAIDANCPNLVGNGVQYASYTKWAV